MNSANIATSLGALGLVIVLLLIGQRLVKYFPIAKRFVDPAATNTRLEITQALTLDPRRRLLLVRCDGRHLLILTGGTQEVSLGWLEPPA